MKKFLLSLTIIAASAFSAAAAVVEFDFTSGYEDTEIVTDLSKDGVSIQMDAGSNSKAPQWYSHGNALRIFTGNIIDLSASKVIESVKFDFADSQYVFKMGTSAPNVKPGKYELCEDGVSGIWTVNARSGRLIAGGGDAHARIQKITVVTVEETGVDSVTVVPNEVSVKGNKIVAPEGAVIYDMSGVRVNGENVSTGIYFVRLADSEVVKVCVK